jgi:hypothetical protein
MAVRINDFVDHVGCVLSHFNYEAAVPSDRAMIDSGRRLCVMFWDTEFNIVRRDDYSHDNCRISVEVDASAEFQKLAEEYNLTVTWIRDTARTIRKAFEIEKGREVEVFKGRKIPKGIYTVVELGNGNYGKYAHLRDSAGKVHRYISMDNIRIAPSAEQVYGTLEYGGFFKGVCTIYADGDRIGLAILADQLEERDDYRAPHVRSYIKAMERHLA